MTEIIIKTLTNSNLSVSEIKDALDCVVEECSNEPKYYVRYNDIDMANLYCEEHMREDNKEGGDD